MPKALHILTPVALNAVGYIALIVARSRRTCTA